MATVHIPSTLRELSGGVAEVEIEAATVRRLIAALEERFPGMGERLRDGTSVSINGEIMPDALYEDIPDGAEVHFLPTLAGG
ncbi:MAG: MoaD/ThiS family protein [Actinomycetota bacterium]